MGLSVLVNGTTKGLEGSGWVKGLRLQIAFVFPFVFGIVSIYGTYCLAEREF